MPDLGSAAARFVFICLNVAFVAFSVWLFAFLTDTTGISDCVSAGFSIHCEILRPDGFGWPAHLVVLLASLAALILIRTVFTSFAAVPFFALAGATLIFCSGFDLLFNLPVKNFSQLFSETFNLLSFVIFLSFSFAIAITPGDLRMFPRFLAAMLQSYVTRDLVFLFYVGIQGHYPGMTGLYLLFVVYSFGAFTIHIMSVAGVVRRSGRLRVAADKSSARRDPVSRWHRTAA